MPRVQPPNEQTLRPQVLTQVGHEGNPVEFSVTVTEGDLLTPDEPALVPPILPGAGGGGAPLLPLSGASGGVDCEGEGSAAITVTGGTPPYSYAASTGTVVDNGNGSATWTPPANTFSGDPSIVGYKYCARYINNACAGNAVVAAKFNCSGDVISDCTVSGTSCTNFEPATACDPASSTYCAVAEGITPDFCKSGACIVCGTSDPECGSLPQADICTGLESFKSGFCYIDSPGCDPCEIVMHRDSPIVTVTDANGVTLAIALESLVVP